MRFATLILVAFTVVLAMACAAPTSVEASPCANGQCSSSASRASAGPVRRGAAKAAQRVAQRPRLFPRLFSR